MHVIGRTFNEVENCRPKWEAADMAMIDKLEKEMT